MKRYLVTAGWYYYPGAGSNDWVGCYESLDEANQVAKNKTSKDEVNMWSEVIDLEEWIK